LLGSCAEWAASPCSEGWARIELLFGVAAAAGDPKFRESSSIAAYGIPYERGYLAAKVVAEEIWDKLYKQLKNSCYDA
jgi:hypothetical protein